MTVLISSVCYIIIVIEISTLKIQTKYLGMSEFHTAFGETLVLYLASDEGQAIQVYILI